MKHNKHTFFCLQVFFFQLIELSRFPHPFPLVSPKQANVTEIDQQQRQRKHWILVTNANATTEIWPLVWCTPPPQKVGSWNQRLTLPGKEPRCWLERPNLLAIPVSASEENANLPGAKHKEAYSKKKKSKYKLTHRKERKRIQSN